MVLCKIKQERTVMCIYSTWQTISTNKKYCRFGNVRENLIFANQGLKSPYNIGTGKMMQAFTKDLPSMILIAGNKEQAIR